MAAIHQLRFLKVWNNVKPPNKRRVSIRRRVSDERRILTDAG